MTQIFILKLAFVFYADFECFTKTIHSCSPNPKSSHTNKYQQHTPSGFCLFVKYFNNTIGCNLDPFVYSKKNEEDDVANKFVKVLENITMKI